MSNTIKDVDIEMDYAFLLPIPRLKMKEMGILEEYMQHRGGDKFDTEGYDHITILQAKLIGLIK